MCPSAYPMLTVSVNMENYTTFKLTDIRKNWQSNLSEVRLSCLVGRTFLLLVDVHIIVLHGCNVVRSYLDTC